MFIKLINPPPLSLVIPYPKISLSHTYSRWYLSPWCINIIIDVDINIDIDIPMPIPMFVQMSMSMSLPILILVLMVMEISMSIPIQMYMLFNNILTQDLSSAFFALYLRHMIEVGRSIETIECSKQHNDYYYGCDIFLIVYFPHRKSSSGISSFVWW